MSKQSKIIIIIVVFLILLFISFIGYFLVKDTGKPLREITLQDIKKYYPVSESVSTEQTRITTTGTEPTTKEEQKEIGIIPMLRQISSTPTAGAISIQDKTTDIIKYVEKATGHVYETRSDSLDTIKISNTTIPKVNDALWTGENSLVLRYLNDDKKTIESFYGEIKQKSATSTQESLEGFFLPKNIKEISTINKKIFYITNEITSNGSIFQLQNNKKIELWNSPLLEWVAQWPEENTITLTTKPSQGIQGFMFLLNSKNGNIRRVLAGEGLTTLTNSNASKILYSANSEESVSLGVYDLKKDASLNLSLRTLAEKCAWSEDNIIVYCGVPKQTPAGNYPDSWYQGVISFSDDIWEINTETGNITLIIEPNELIDGELDIIKPSFSRNKYFLFINKKDSTLWSYKILK